MRKSKSLVGSKIGRLEVIALSDRVGYVICQCDCGTIKHIRATQLTKSNPIQSCGCLQREKAVGIGSRTSLTNFHDFHTESEKYHTNFHMIEATKPCANNKSGVTGVWFNMKRNAWEAYINLHRKRIFLGRFSTKDEAIRARRVAEEEYFKPLIEQRNKDKAEIAG